MMRMREASRRWPGFSSPGFGIAFGGVALCLALTGCAPRVTARSEGRAEYEFSTGPQASSLIDKLDVAIRAAPVVRLHLLGELSEGWTPVVSFVHVSDVQIRDHGIVFEGEHVESVNDWIAGGAVRNAGLDRNDEFPVAALIEGLNREVSSGCGSGSIEAAACPAFVIHTGDAIDAGSRGEMLQFLNVFNRLWLPWFSVVGNHDVFLFGNFSQRRLTAESLIGFETVNSRQQFLALHGAEGRELLQGEADRHFTNHAVTEFGTAVVPASDYHGFDHRGGQTGDRGSYYSFVLSNTSPRLRIVVLDTVAEDEDTEMRTVGGFFGFHGLQLPGKGAWVDRLDEEQIAWLRNEMQLARAPENDEYLLVFGHHPLSDKEGRELRYAEAGSAKDESFRELLAREPRLLGYFAGHTHAPMLRGEPRDDGSMLAEVTAASYHEYPPVAFLVTVLRRDDELALAVRALQASVEGGGALESRTRAACRGSLADAGLTLDDCLLGASPDLVRTFAPVAQGVASPPLATSGLSRVRHPILLDTSLHTVAGRARLGNLLDAMQARIGERVFAFVIDDSVTASTRMIEVEIEAADQDLPIGPFLERILERASQQMTGEHLDFSFDASALQLTVFQDSEAARQE